MNTPPTIYDHVWNRSLGVTSDVTRELPVGEVIAADAMAYILPDLSQLCIRPDTQSAIGAGVDSFAIDQRTQRMRIVHSEPLNDRQVHSIRLQRTYANDGTTSVSRLDRYNAAADYYEEDTQSPAVQKVISAVSRLSVDCFMRANNTVLSADAQHATGGALVGVTDRLFSVAKNVVTAKNAQGMAVAFAPTERSDEVHARIKKMKSGNMFIGLSMQSPGKEALSCAVYQLGDRYTMRVHAHHNDSAKGASERVYSPQKVTQALYETLCDMAAGIRDDKGALDGGMPPSDIIRLAHGMND